MTAKRTFCFLLALVMVIGMLPVPGAHVHAEENDPTDGQQAWTPAAAQTETDSLGSLSEDENLCPLHGSETDRVLGSGDVSVGDQAQMLYANSDCEAYSKLWCYGIDRENGDLLYRQDYDFSEPEYLSREPVQQITFLDGFLYVLLERNGSSIIVRMDEDGTEAEKLCTLYAPILRFAVAEGKLFYLSEETIYQKDADSLRSEALLQVQGLSRFWLASELVLEYIAGDDSQIHQYELATGESYTYANRISSLEAADASVQGLSLSQMRSKFPHGKYWNHAGNPGAENSKNNQNGYTTSPCTVHKVVGTSKQTCNGFQPGDVQLSWQCMGYAEKLGYDATGYNPRDNADGWYTNSSASALDSLKAGDIVRYRNNGHSIYVIGVNGDTVTYTDCNSSGTCNIRWDATISKSTLRSTFTNVRSAPGALNPEPVSCNCSTSYAGNYICTTSSSNLNMRSGHGTGYSIVTAIPSGATVYVSKASGMNAGDWAHVEYNGYSGYASMEYLHVHLGDSFYANIINTAHWKFATNDDHNVSNRVENGMLNQLWHFERWDDGGYKITSVYDGRCLDVMDFGTHNGANVQVYEDNGSTAQRWDIAGAEGGYILSARCADTVLDVADNSSADGANLQMCAYNGSGAQLYTIRKTENYDPYACGCQSCFANDYVCAADNVNIHYGHGSDFRVIGTIPAGATVHVSKASGMNAGDWAHVEYNGISGYASMEYLHVHLGDSFYANIINTAHWKFATNDDHNVSNRVENGMLNQLWHFERWDDGGYKITSVYDGRCLDVMDFGTHNGANVQVYEDNGSTAQRWDIAGAEGGYILSARCADTVLDVADNSSADGANLQMCAYNGCGAQFFTIRKLEGYEPHACSCLDSFAGDYVCAAEGVNIHYGFGSSYRVIGTIPAGATVHVSKAGGMKAGDWAHVEYNGISGYAPMEHLHVDLGTGFYANIIHVSQGHYLTNDDPNVSTRSANAAANQVWYFERWEDGGYKIISMYDGECLDVVNYGTEDGTNVQVYDDWNNMAQRWDIVGAEGRYILSARCADTVLDVTGNGWEEGTNVQMYSFHGGPEQLFAIEKLEDYDTATPPCPTITFSSSGQDMNAGNYSLGESVTISWHAENSDSYWFRIQYDEDPSYVIDEGGTYESYTFTPEKPGSYTVSMRAYNEAGDSGMSSRSFRVRTVVGDTWVSDTPLGAEEKNFPVDTELYYNYKLFDPLTGEQLYTFSTMDYTVELFIIDPAEQVVTSQTFLNSDSNYMPFRCTTPGTYKMQVSLNGGVFYDTFTIYETYTVSYDGNGGENAPAAQEKIEGADLVLHTQIPTRSGYAFLGWALSADASVPVYQPGDSYCEDASVTLYAVWEKNNSRIASGWSGYTQWSLTDDGVLTFSGEGAMKNYTYKSEMPWYSYADQIKTVVIGEGVTSIGAYAFYGMGVENIEIASTVTSIGDYAFKNAPKIDNVVLPENLTSLGDSAFYACTSLSSIEIPASLWTIKPYTFKNCTALAEVIFHEGNLQKISDGAFYGTALTELVLPDCLDILDVYSFKNCASLESITLGSGITELREAVFYGTAIPEITIPEGITKIGPYAFKNCVKLETIDLPESLTSVGEASFYACTGLKSVELPDAVTTIGNYAFRKCAAIEELTLGSELITIGECAFYGCTGLTELVIPDKVTIIKPYAFKGCTDLEYVTLPDSLTTLGDSAFHTCTSLSEVTIPGRVTKIGEYCFSGSSTVSTITFQGDAPAIGAGAFNKITAIARYPGANATWTSAVRQNYGGTITWIAD